MDSGFPLEKYMLQRCELPQDLASLPPLPPPLPPDMLFTLTPDLARLALAPGAGPFCGTAEPNPDLRARIGRGGRLVLDRCRAAGLGRFDGAAAAMDEARHPRIDLPRLLM